MSSQGPNKDVVADSQVLVWNHIFGVVNSLVLKCALKANILDAIHRHAAPINLSQLGSSLSVPPANLSILHRILRYLAHMNIIDEVMNNNDEKQDDHDDDVLYALAPAAKLLLKGEERSLAPFVEFFLDEGILGSVHALDSCVYGDTNTPAYDQLKGESFWDQVSRDPGLNKMFNEGMASRAQLAIAGIVEFCGEAFEGVRTLVDVGGGTGTTARAIAGAFSHVHCTVLDQPHVVDGLPASLRVDYVGGDMFASIPQADAVLLMCVLHDWNDNDCLRILKQCKEAIPSDGGKLFIVDLVILGDGDDEDDGDDGFHGAKLAFDVVMLTTHAGKERTEKEWKELLTRAGFSGYKITPIETVQHLIEAHV